MMCSPSTRFVQNLKRFRLVTFDITDTLLRFRQAPSIEYARVAAQFDINIADHERLEKCFKQEFRLMSRKYPNFGRNTIDLSWYDWWRLLVKNIFHCMDPNIEETKLKLLAERLIEIYRTKECWCLMDGTEEILRRIKENHKILGVISNFDPSLSKVLKEMEILDNFDFVLTSYEAGFQKPDANIYGFPLRKYDLEPHEALHIGNLYSLDYLGARQAGWSSLLITSIEKELQKADENHTFSNLCELITALDSKLIKW